MRKRAASMSVTSTSIKLPRLSPGASRFIKLHPEQAQIAVGAALEALAARFQEESRAASSIPVALRPFLVEGTASTAAGELIGVDEAAKRLHVSRATVYNWIDAKRLIGWRLTRQGTLIPAEQIVGPNELVAGIDDVLKLISAPRAAWRFLSEKSQFLRKPRRPLDALKAGLIPEVLAAARAEGEAFT